MSDEQSVSVIIPVYKPNVEYLAECVDSLLHQTYKNWEAIFVIDDVVTPCDPTLSYLDSRSDNRIKIIGRTEKYSPANARNIGIYKARGEFITFLDCDDIYLPNKIMREVKFLQENPQLDWCWSYTIHFDGKKEMMYTEAWDNPRPETMLPFQSFMIRKSLADKISCKYGYVFDESLHQIDDYDLYLRIKEYSYSGIKEPLVRYRVHTAGLTSGSNWGNVTKLQIKINIKHRNYKNAISLSSLYATNSIRIFLRNYKNIIESKIRKYIMAHRIALQVEPTTRCNLNCIKCSRGNDTPIVDLTANTFAWILQQHKKPYSILLQGLGEPFMHPYFDSICAIAKQNCTEVIVVSNGTILNKDALQYIDHLVISLDTLDGELAKSTRGTNYDIMQVIENISYLHKHWNGSLAVNYVRAAYNFDQEPALQLFCDQMGIQLHITPVQNWYNPEEPEWVDAHNTVMDERKLSGCISKSLKENCPFIKGRKFYYDARGIRHPCCIRMRYNQITPTKRMCETCPE